MSESAMQPSGGPSLEQILWRAMDRWQEAPALVDADEFAAHIEGVFQGDLPAETWVARFFEGESGAQKKKPADLAEAIVRSTRDRLAVYEFDLRKLEYVIVEDDEKVVVVSDFGQFALRNDDLVSRAIEAAVIPGGTTRGGGDPRAYFVRGSGEVVAVDVKKVARSLEQLLVRQVSMPAVSRPGARMTPFGAARRSLSEGREAQALRQDARTRQAAPVSPRLDRAPSATALFILMPDGSLARPEMGSATRWQEMMGRYARDRVTVQAGNVVAIIQQAGASGTVGERAQARAEGLFAVRGDSAPIRMLGDDDLAKAFAAGAMAVPGLSRSERFWIQPEASFGPNGKALAQGGAGAGKGALVSRSHLGELTSDPWADWALTSGVPPRMAEKLRGVRGQELGLTGGALVGFRAADGTAAPLASRSGAIPATALAALQMALERTANAGGYKLPTLRIESARDALDAGGAMDLSLSDPRRSSVRLAGLGSTYAGPSGQVAQLMLSMPFPNGGELHVGSDLSDALQAYLGNAVQPASGGMVLRVRGGAAGQDLVSGGGLFDWGGLHAQAAQRAQDAVLTLELPSVQPLVAGSSSVSGLPLLLQRAVAQAGDWTPGTGAGVPIDIREFALRGPFDGGAPDLVSLLPQPRPLNPGEDEIVIPRPLWAQLGRGQLSETDQIMASPLARTGYTPPLGVYRLAVPGGSIWTAASVLSQGGGDSDASVALASSAPSGTYIDGSYSASLAARTTAGGSDQTLVAASGPGLAEMMGATAGASNAASTASRGSGTPSLISPQPGMWSGQRRSDTAGSRSWSYAGESHSAGGVNLGSLSRPIYPSLPTALRFRYAGAPLWWSGSTRFGAMSAGGFEESDSAPAGRALRAGLRAATSAASIWRSILVSSPQWDGPADDLSGGMDSGHDASADEMSSLSRRFDALTAASLVGSGAGAGGAAFVAVDGSGAAGTVSRAAARRAKLDSIEMSIVAAIPPAPPPLASMGSGMTGGDAPHARAKGAGHGQHHGHKEGADAVSHSKIEGSVDAIAQRIYHRIRRRIQSDRERFGG